MARTIRCKVTGCDLDDCGICRRCGDSSKARHSWAAAESENPCYRRETCDRCGATRDQPSHDWEPSSQVGPDGVALKCSRCGLTI